VRPLSIRLRLSLLVSGLTLTIIVALSVSAYIEFRESLLGNIDTTLRAMSEGMRATLDGEQTPEDRKAELHAIAGYGQSGHHGQYRIWTDGTETDFFASGSPEDPLEPQLLHPPADKRPDVGDLSLFDVPVNMESGRRHILRTLWMRHTSGGRVVNILVALSSDYVYHEVGEFLQLLLILGGSVALLASLLMPRIIAWGLRSISLAGAQLEQITHRSLGQEDLAMGDVPVELRPFKASLQGMLMRLNDAMRRQEQLTADVAHELRTPLAIIKSTLQTLRMRPRDATAYEEGIDDALQDVERMEHLMEQILSLARLDAATEVPNPAEVRLDTLLGSLADVFNDRARQQGASVVYADGAVISVRGDETELRQLFSNLLDNALRYGPPKGVVRIALQEGPQQWATVCVHDEGGAIPPESLPCLFDRFYRVDSSRSQASGGSGLGLAIVREIVQRHHGDIQITSDGQSGTSVVVHLPRS
jgi:two-component system heavy metal sensor histidine kinase CusS